ncbi:NPC intracellular cholesterol transporter 2 homolog a [Drosophila guanche]|uniref:Blast:Protein NPC2 homolog n=1 Tax=Drosophila guanche TaxID=7266 RepID=A0A3B0JF70_DROGU|nr:NPC intracellular cholesterol transporter 2 homolog a [Drosophila guanche]SPP79323.1 blast:Protein NPC2 homolog [Drosophila guanche]
MLRFAVIACLLVTVGLVQGLEFSDCGSKTGKFTRVVIEGCDTTKSECILKRNTTVSFSIDINLAEEATAVKTVVHGKVLGIEMPFPLANPNACVNSGLKCPLEKGESYRYTATLPVLKTYPKVSVLVKWELQDQNSEDIICVEIPAKIQ